MRRLLTGCFVTLLLLLNTLVLIGPLMVFALLKLVAPGRWRDYASGAVMWIAETWAEIDKLIFRLCIPTQWDIRGGDDLLHAGAGVALPAEQLGRRIKDAVFRLSLCGHEICLESGLAERRHPSIE